MTIGRRIVAGFAAIIVIATILASFAFTQLRIIAAHSTHVTTDCLAGIYLVDQLQFAAQENDGLLLKCLLTKGADTVASAEKTIESNLNKMGAYTSDYEKTFTQGADQDQIVAFDRLQSDYCSLVRKCVDLAKDGQAQQALELKQSQIDPILVKFHDEVTLDKEKAEAASRHIQAAVSAATLGTGVGLAGMFLGSIVISLLMAATTTKALGSIAQKLEAGSDRVSQAAGQVSGAARTLAEGASEQAASIEQTSSSLEEMSSMTKRNAEHAENAKQLSAQTRAAADTGFQDMKQMSEAMDAIKTSGDNISKIIKTIDEIAFQTNILALNAAVEAARAGEAGMGFAVVANEVRSLAHRSAQAAKETSEKIADSINRSARAAEISGRVAASLQEILDKARKVDELVAGIASASSEQSQGIGQVNNAVGEMSKVTQNNAATAEESAAEAEELNHGANGLRLAVKELTQLIGGRQNSAPVRLSETVSGPSSLPAELVRDTGEQSSSPSLVMAGNGSAMTPKIPMPGDNNFRSF
jgi:methyl-accepting chemotaxis protein